MKCEDSEPSIIQENENSKNEQYIDINTIAKLKWLTITRSLRLEINKPNSKYIVREIKVNGGTPYEILYASLEPEIQRIFASAESTKGSEHDKAKKPPEHRNCASNFISGVQGFGGRIIQDEKLDDDEIFSRALVPYEEKPRNTLLFLLSAKAISFAVKNCFRNFLPLNLPCASSCSFGYCLNSALRKNALLPKTHD